MKSGVDCSVAPSSLLAPFLCASRQGDVQAVVERLAKGDNIEKKGGFSRTALHVAADKGHAPVVEVLLDAKANVNKTDMFGRSPLLLASDNGHAPVVRLLLEKGQADANLASSNTPLICAVINNNTEVASLLIDIGHANPDLDPSGSTALMIAAAKGRTGMVNLLVEKANARLDMFDNYGRTALWNSKSACTALLVLHGAQDDLSLHYEPRYLRFQQQFLQLATAFDRERSLAKKKISKRVAIERGLALREQVARYREERQAAVLGQLDKAEVMEDVAKLVAGYEGQVPVSMVLKELGIRL